MFVAEQEEVAKSKPKGELLTRENLSNMKYTWEEALKTLRMFPLLFVLNVICNSQSHLLLAFKILCSLCFP